jgi:hypothetical protein
MGEQDFELPESGYDLISKIIQGYLRAGADAGPKPLSTVAQTTTISVPQISSNNKFLASIGVLVKEGQKYKLSAEGARLAVALGYPPDAGREEVQGIWSGLIAANDFLRRVLSAVEIRGEMETEAFAQHIALTSGAPHERRYLTGARAVVDVLLAAGLLVKQNGSVRIAPAGAPTHGPAQGFPSQEEAGKGAAATGLDRGLMTSLNVLLNIEISPQMEDADLKVLAGKVRAFARYLATWEAPELKE